MNTLSKNTNLRSTVQVYHFFLGSIDFQCMFSLVFTVYCQKQPPEQRCSVKKVFKKSRKFHRKTPLLESLLNKVAGLTPILKNIYQRLHLHCTHFTLLLIRFTLCSAPSSSSSLLLFGSSRPKVCYQKRCSYKFWKIHWKTPVAESLFQ